MKWTLSRQDLFFLVDTLMPQSRDRERDADLVQSDERLLEAMLDDEQVFQRLVNQEEAVVAASPQLFFTVLLRRARRELLKETFTVERRSQQKVVLFDAERVVKLLQQEPLQDYLAAMLASFTRIGSVTVPVRVRKGIWRRYRANDLDVESLMRYSEALDQEFRFEPYKRIGDVCLFLAGLFPDYIQARHRYPASGQIRPSVKGRLIQSLEDYEKFGQAFYRLAAQHERARVLGLADTLVTLSDEFVLAEKPLTFLVDRYLRFSKNKLFEV